MRCLKGRTSMHMFAVTDTSRKALVPIGAPPRTLYIHEMVCLCGARRTRWTTDATRRLVAGAVVA